MAKRRFFRLAGRLHRQGEGPIQGGQLQLLDQDDNLDDLIAHGSVREDGSFEVSFTRESFNQDWRENEDLPQLYLQMVEPHPEGLGWLVSYRQQLPELRFAEGYEELGDLELVPAQLDEQKPVTALPLDWRSNVRLRLDDEAMEHILAEVGPRLDALLGTTKPLLEGLTIERESKLRGAVERAVAAQQQERRVPVQFLDAAGVGSLRGPAFYDPFTSTLWLDRAKMEEGGLDFTKAVLAEQLMRRWWYQQDASRVDNLRRWYGLMNPLDRHQRRRDEREALDAKVAEPLLTTWLALLHQEAYFDHVRAHLISRAYPFSKHVFSMSFFSKMLVSLNFSSGMADLKGVRADERGGPEATERAELLASLAAGGLDALVYSRELNPYHQLASGRGPSAPVAPLDEGMFGQVVKKAVARARRERDQG